jgi:hypothetical protein
VPVGQRLGPQQPNPFASEGDVFAGVHADVGSRARRGRVHRVCTADREHGVSKKTNDTHKAHQLRTCEQIYAFCPT